MIVYRNFEGDVRQPPGAVQNDVTFKEATTVFAAEDVVISEDPSSGDLRAVGTSARGRKLVVRHRRGLRIRILAVALCDEDGHEIVVPTSAGERADAPIESEPSTSRSEAITIEGKPVIATTAIDEDGARQRSIDADPVAALPVLTAARSASTARGERGDETAAVRAAAVETPAPGRRGRPRREVSASQSSFDDVLSKAAAREPEHATPTSIEDDGAATTIAADPRRVERAPEARRAPRERIAPSSIVAASPPTIVATAPAKNGEQTNGWTAETYDLYWSAYTTARDEARRQGKSTREAQRLGREAGERAATTRREPQPKGQPAGPQPPKKQRSRSGSWREAARAVKVEG